VSKSRLLSGLAAHVRMVQNYSQLVFYGPYQVVNKTKHAGQSPRPVGSWLTTLCAAVLASSTLALVGPQPTHAQGAVSASDQVHLITQAQPILLAQATNPAPGILPTDQTKTGVQQQFNLKEPGLSFRVNQRLPTRLFYTLSCETTQRLDTNVFLSYKMPQPDYVFRVAPSASVGYNIFNNTSVYASYFSIKDNYTVHNRGLSNPVTQSVQMGVRHTFYPTADKRTSLQLDGGARELWQSRGLRQADLIPSATLSHYSANYKHSFYASALMQLRSQELFLGAKREIDPFYTIGYYYNHYPWYFSFSSTLITDYREPHFRYSIPHHGNVSEISDFEFGRGVLTKKFTGLQAFVRAEPVFNWRSADVRGLSGFDFRLYSGLRLTVQKQSYLAMVNNIKQTLKNQDDDAAFKAKKKGAKNKPAPGVSPTQNPDGTPTESPTTPSVDTKDTKQSQLLIQPGIASAQTPGLYTSSDTISNALIDYKPIDFDGVVIEENVAPPAVSNSKTPVPGVSSINTKTPGPEA
jgi:hypothetical protein